MTDGSQNSTTDDGISRRRVCQALSVVGGVDIAGCSSDGEQSGGSGSPPDSERSQPPTPVDEESITVEGDDAVDTVSPAAVIDAHNTAIDGVGYTVAVAVQGENSDPNVVKEITYKRSESGQTIVSLAEIATVDDGVQDLQQVFTPDDTYTLVTLDTGEELVSTTDTRDLTDYISIDITGSSVFAEFLADTTIERESGRMEEGDRDGYSGTYTITDHRRLDAVDGTLGIRDDGVVELFELEWTDENGERRWIDVDVSQVGETAVDIPSV